MENSDNVKMQDFVSHFYASIEQPLVDLVVSHLPPSITLIDITIPFERISSIEGFNREETTYDLNSEQVKEIVKNAVQNNRTEELYSKVRELKSEVDDQDSIIQKHIERCETSTPPVEWKGPSEEKLKAFKRLEFPVKVHLSHVSVVLTDKPSVHLTGERTDIDGVDVRVNATVQFWWKVPRIVGCTAHCPWPLNDHCCIPKIDFVWTQKGHIDVSLKVASDATLTAKVENLSVWLSGSFRRLRLDYQYFDQIKFENVVNPKLSEKKKQVLDLAKLIATIPILNDTYGISNAIISGTNELRVDTEVAKL